MPRLEVAGVRGVMNGVKGINVHSRRGGITPEFGFKAAEVGPGVMVRL